MRRSTVILVILALAAVGAYYLLTSRQQAAQPSDAIVTLEPTREVSYLFDAADGVPTGIRIVAKTGESVEVKRNAENAWELVMPVIASADQGAAEAAASEVSAIRVLDRVSGVDPEVLGLKSPEYRLFITFTSGVERKAEIGVITPSESGYYARNEKGETVIVSKDSLDSLLGLLTNPPVAVTPTPGTTATAQP